MPNTSHLLVVTAPPFWHCGRTIKGAMQLTLLALLPAACAAVYHWGLPALRVMALCVAVAVLTEALLTLLMKRQVRVDNLTAVVTGLCFSFLLPATVPWWLAAFGTFVTMGVGRMAFGGYGASPLCPPLVGWAALFISWPLLMDPNAMLLNTAFVDPLLQLKFFGDAQSVPWQDMLLGMQIGALGASQVGLLFLGGCALCALGVVRWEISVSFLVGVAVTAALFNAVAPDMYATPLFHLLTGSTVFGAFFLATEASCSPNRSLPMFLYGLIGGVLTMLIRNCGIYADGVPFAILLINLLMPQLELIRPKPFGVR